jgi:hypothetical protein
MIEYQFRSAEILLYCSTVKISRKPPTTLFNYTNDIFSLDTFIS